MLYDGFSFPKNDKQKGTPMLIKPGKLYIINEEVTEENGIVKQNNYIHFYNYDEQAGMKVYRFLVAFNELAAYPYQVKALWIQHTHPLLWKYHILHTYNSYVYTLHVPDFDLSMEGDLFFHLTKNKDDNYEKLEVYA